jgi:CRISPR-associated endonuclease/helicase Cas3
MGFSPPLAHSPGHLLDDHLRSVASLAESFAAAFGSGETGRLAGLWHDLGKYRPGFQHYIRQTPDAHIEQRVTSSDKTHSLAGAAYALHRRGDEFGRVLAFLIAGHHAGLPDRQPEPDGAPAAASLQARLSHPDGRREYEETLSSAIPPDILEAEVPTCRVPGNETGYALWMRMLFSSLVDADFLDTEAYFDAAKGARRGQYPSLREMKVAFDTQMSAMSARVGPHSTSIQRHRADVLARCRASAALPPGFFTLTVPTGGGKTLSSLAFALEHALAHGKRRIVYAIPYTSIIEQNAAVFRHVFARLGENAVIEHHSNLDVDERTEDCASRLAAENWDAPLIVTTNVQLFESLHAASTSRCRKLHNLVDSVIVLDEAQMLPRGFLAPVLRVLKLLVAHYGVTVVLCTATQPALASRREPGTNRKVLDGIDDARSIVGEPEALFKALERVDVHMPADFSARRSWDEIAGEIRRHDCVLAIVNTRKDARELFKQLKDEEAVHLSALMCAEHRSAAIAGIRERLMARQRGISVRPLRVISTQLVEAGVDLDFPVVYRALAGLDSIAQAAGRCNREGRLAGNGQVHVFVPPHRSPPGLLLQGEQTTRELAATGRLLDPFGPETFRNYFDLLYGKGDLDEEDVLDLLRHDRAAFRTAAQRFRLIDDDGETVIVPYAPGDMPGSASPVHAWLTALAKGGDAKWARRKLQRYTINVPRRLFDRLVEQGDVEERAGLWLALDSRYDPVFGLLLPDDHGKPVDYLV